jgi:hypothetical protein
LFQDWDFDWLTAVSCALVQNWLKIAWVVDLAWIGDLDQLDPATFLNHLTFSLDLEECQHDCYFHFHH